MELNTKQERMAPQEDAGKVGNPASAGQKIWACKEEFEEQEEKGLREPLLSTKVVQNGNLTGDVGARNCVVPIFHTVIIDDETRKILEKENENNIAKEDGGGNGYVGHGARSMAPQSSALDSLQLNFTTICRHIPTYVSNINPDPPVPEAELNQELTNQLKSQTQTEVYCLNITEKDNMKKRRNAFFTAGSLRASSAVFEDTHIPEQIQDVNQNLSLGHAMRRSTRCAAANCMGQQSYKLSSFQAATGNQDGTKGKKGALQTPEEPAPPARKKTRTFYSAEQLDELERMFQEDHYPDNEKRREVATAVGVTPQRVMVWFQNRRAKWRKIEKLTVKGNKKCSATTSALSTGPQQISHGVTLLPVPPLSDMVHDQPAAFMMETAGDVNSSSLVSGQSVPLASTSVISLTGRTTPYESVQTKVISPGTFGSLKEEIFPAIPSPPPIHRASLPFNMIFNPNNHIVPLMLDTPSSEYSPASQESSSSEAFTYSIQNPSSDTPVHCSYPEQLEPTANLEMPYCHPNSQSGVSQFSQYPQLQVPQLHHFPVHFTGGALSSVRLTPATPSCIPAFQAMPWNDFYVQGAPFSNQLCSQTQFSRSGRGCCSAEQAQYTQNQSVPPSSCLLQLPSAAVPAATTLFTDNHTAAADPSANLDNQSQMEHTVPPEKDSDTDNSPKDKGNISDSCEESKN